MDAIKNWEVLFPTVRLRFVAILIALGGCVRFQSKLPIKLPMAVASIHAPPAVASGAEDDLGARFSLARVASLKMRIQECSR